MLVSGSWGHSVLQTPALVYIRTRILPLGGARGWGKGNSHSNRAGASVCFGHMSIFSSPELCSG